MPSSESRDAILRAARDEFAGRGFAGARVNRIARAAGLNKQLIYYYFGSKSALYGAATGIPPGASPADVADAATGSETIRRVVDDLLRALASRPEVVSLLVDRSRAPDSARAARQWIEGAQDAALAALSRGQGLGHFRDSLDQEAVARLAVVLCVGYLALAPHLDVGADEWSREVHEALAYLTAW